MAKTVTNLKAEVPLHGLADTLAEVEAKTLYESLSNLRPRHFLRCCMTR